MANKKIIGLGNLVFSTNPDWKPETEEEPIETLAPEKQKLKVTIDKKKRAGKTVTLITGFVGNDEDLQILAKTIKTKCGVGGSSKDGEILIQGEYKEKVEQILTSLKYGFKR